MSPPLLALIAAFLVFGAIGMPIGLAMINAGLIFLILDGRDLALAAEQILNSLFNSFVLLAVPLFILAANIMNAGTISERLLAFCLALVGRLKGGLAHVNVLASLVFSGMSGSAIADAAGVGKLIIGMMREKERYPAGFAAAITAASATIGPIIPPSIPMVLYALVADTSVGYLFLGGVVPGVFMALALMTTIWIVARRRDFPVEAPVALREMPRLAFRAFPALLLPVILLGGIYGGATTPTEAAAVAAAYALLLAGLFYRALSLGTAYAIFKESARSTAIVTLIIAGAFVFNYVIAAEQVPALMAAWLAGVEVSPTVFLLVVAVVFLLLGCLLDATTMILILVPLLMPSIRALGIDTVHFGVTITVNIMIGLITPPYGVLLFVINGLTGISLRSMIAEIWPFLGILIASLLVMLLVPEITLWLPRLFGYKD